ncbi:MAG: S-methyl-5'-thioadenosine phosphorylase [Nanoarchaeota archaeon]|nr:S-methyl-5'-thioadenosine phosphorylase [Nanoarchaeota archaeon]
MAIGIIGGSGLDDPEMIENPEEKEVSTPYGSPSSALTTGKINGVDVVILARHGKKHSIPPTAINNRANIYALNKIGCTHILATTACGSLKEEINRGHFVILDQFIDFTRLRKLTFHEEFKDAPLHTPMAEPFDEELRNKLIETCRELKLPHHERGTVVTIEGSRFSTKAESLMFRSWGADVINMSTAPECILANEAGLKYAAVAMSTDYDCWRESEAPVTWEEIVKTFNKNGDNVKKILINTLNKIK